MHRMFAVLALVALPLSAETFEARSPHHLFSIERNVRGAGVTYDVRVTDLDSKSVLLTSTLNGARDQQLKSEVKGDPSVWVQVGESNDSLSAVMRVESHGVTKDVITASWAVASAAPAPPAGPLRVGGDVKAPVVRTRVNPLYPETARKDNVEGVVIMELLIDATGHVRNVTVLKGLPDGLSEAAVAAVRQWTFDPATRNGQPVDVIFNVTLAFHLKSQYPFPGEG
jgi:TonB family protein